MHLINVILGFLRSHLHTRCRNPFYFYLSWQNTKRFVFLIKRDCFAVFRLPSHAVRCEFFECLSLARISRRKCLDWFFETNTWTSLISIEVKYRLQLNSRNPTKLEARPASPNNNLVMCWELGLIECGEEVDWKDWLCPFPMWLCEMHHSNRRQAATIQARHIKPQLSWWALHSGLNVQTLPAD